MAIPPFDSETGLLPPGESEAAWDEIEARFGRTLRRSQLLDGLADRLALFAEARCSRVWLNGSFVTDKDEPDDFDCVWSSAGVDRELLERIGPELLDLGHHRAAQKARFGGEFLPNVTERSSGQRFAEFFQTSRGATSKGIVVIDPTKEQKPSTSPSPSAPFSAPMPTSPDPHGTVTLDRYGHLFLKLDETLTQRLDNLYRAAVGSQ